MPEGFILCVALSHADPGFGHLTCFGQETGKHLNSGSGSLGNHNMTPSYHALVRLKREAPHRRKSSSPN